MKRVVQHRFYSSLRNLSDKSATVSANDTGLSKFMTRVYGHMGLGVTSSLCVAMAASPFVLGSTEAILSTFGIGIVATFGGVYGIDKLKPTYSKTTLGAKYAEDVPLRKASFASLSLGMGLVMAPMVNMIDEIDPTILPLSVIMSGTIFGGCALIAARAKNADLMQWKAPLAVGLTSLIGIQLVGIGSTLLFGPSAFSSMLHNVDIYGGIGLFTMMSIYDAHSARQLYLTGEPDHIGCATNVYLDFMNILIRVMSAMAKNSKKH